MHISASRLKPPDFAVDIAMLSPESGQCMSAYTGSTLPEMMLAVFRQRLHCPFRTIEFYIVTSSWQCADAKCFGCSSRHLCVASTQVHDTEVALMVPTADLANHSFQYNSTYALRTARGAFELNSCRPLNAGDAICISYGSDKTNAELMRDYGELDTLMTAYEL